MTISKSFSRNTKFCIIIHIILKCVANLTHWGRVTHIYVSNFTIIGSDNDLSPGRRQAIIWINAVMLNEHLVANFSEISIGIHTFSSKKIHLKISSGQWCPFCLGLNVLRLRLTICKHRAKGWLSVDQATSHYPKHDALVQWHIYASTSLDKLNAR